MPIYDKNNVIKLAAPWSREINYWPEETRFDLPFPGEYDTFLYISKFWNEKWYTPTQFHDYFELCYVCAGNGWFILEGMLFPVKGGDIFITKPGEVHCGGAGDSDFLVYAIGFRFEQMGELEKGFYKLGIQRISNDSDEMLRPYFERIMSEIESGDSYKHLMVKSCMLAILTTTYRIYEKQHELADKDTKSLSAEIINVLSLVHSEDNYSGKIAEIAAKVSMSRAHLDREFKRQIGISLGGYLRGVWLERAKQLLRQSDESITSIAEKLQFDSIQAFCMFFKRHLGLSPHEFKELRRKSPPSTR